MKLEKSQRFGGSISSYVGDGNVNRAVAHGLGRTPKAVLINIVAAGGQAGWIISSGFVFFINGGNEHAVTAMDSTNFYVGNAASMTESMNANGFTYRYSVIG